MTEASAPGTASLPQLLAADHRLQAYLLSEMAVRFDLRVVHLPVVTALLIAHLAAERAAVHPVADEVGSDEELLASSAQEHRKIDSLLDQLAKTEPAGFEFDQLLHELTELHTSHISGAETLAADVTELVSSSRLPSVAAQFLATRMLWLAPKPGYQHVWEI